MSFLNSFATKFSEAITVPVLQEDEGDTTQAVNTTSEWQEAWTPEGFVYYWNTVTQGKQTLTLV